MDRPLNILLIEDNPGDAFLIKFYLEDSIFADAKLVHAEFLNSGIELLEKDSFDVILLDLNLPDSKGLETLETVLAAITHSVVIVLTGLTDEELGVQTVKMGSQDFLVKGQFDGKVLTSSIRYAFERYQLQKQVSSYTAELDESKEQFENAQKIGRFGYWELSVNDRSMVWTKGMYDLVGATPGELKPSLENLIKLADKKDAQALGDAFNKVLDNGGAFEIDFTMGEGTTLLCRSMAHTGEDGERDKIIGTIQAKA